MTRDCSSPYTRVGAHTRVTARTRGCPRAHVRVHTRVNRRDNAHRGCSCPCTRVGAHTHVTTGVTARTRVYLCPCAHVRLHTRVTTDARGCLRAHVRVYTRVNRRDNAHTGVLVPVPTCQGAHGCTTRTRVRLCAHAEHTRDPRASTRVSLGPLLSTRVHTRGPCACRRRYTRQRWHGHTQKPRVCRHTQRRAVAAVTRACTRQAAPHTRVEPLHARGGSVTRVGLRTRGAARHGWCYTRVDDGVTCMTASHGMALHV